MDYMYENPIPDEVSEDSLNTGETETPALPQTEPANPEPDKSTRTGIPETDITSNESETGLSDDSPPEEIPESGASDTDPISQDTDPSSAHIENPESGGMQPEPDIQDEPDSPSPDQQTDLSDSTVESADSTDSVGSADAPIPEAGSDEGPADSDSAQPADPVHDEETDTADAPIPEADSDENHTDIDSAQPAEPVHDEKTVAADAPIPEAGSDEGRADSDSAQPADPVHDEETVTADAPIPEADSDEGPADIDSAQPAEPVHDEKTVKADDVATDSETESESVESESSDTVTGEKPTGSESAETDHDSDAELITERYENLLNKCEKLKEEYQSFETKADVLLQVDSLLEYLPQVTFLGDFTQAIQDLEAIQNDAQNHLQESLSRKEALCEQAEAVSESEDWDTTAETFSELQKEWRTIGQVPKEFTDQIWARFRAAKDSFYERYKLHLKEEKQINLIEQEKLCDQAEELSTSTDWKNTSERIASLQAEWKEIGSPPGTLQKRFQAAVDTFFERRSIHFEKMDRERRENLVIKEKLCEIADSLKDSTDWNRTGERFIKLQQDWHQIGPVPQERSDEIWERFCSAADHFFAKRNEFYEKRDAEMLVNLHKKETLCEAAESMMNSEEWVKTGEKLILLQEDWKRIGMVPKDKADAVWDRFRKANDQFFNHRKEHYKEQEKERKANLNLKRDLCTQAEALLDDENWKSAERKMKQLQEDWKKIGPVPKNKSDAVWTRFRSAADTFFEKRNKILESIRAENYVKKEELCKIAEGLIESTEWKETTERFKDLQREWKQTGPVDPEKSDEIWNRFRQAADVFFEKRNHYYEEEDSEWREHLAAKEKLVAKAESISEIRDWRAAEQQLKDLQLEWKQVGFIPQDIADAVWHRFRKAVSEFYSRRNAFYKERDKERKENLKLKIALCEEAEALAGDSNLKQAEKQIVHLKEKWREIGPVPPQKSDAVWKRFRSAIDGYFDNRSEVYDENLKVKQKLCETVEKLNVSSDIHGSIEKVKKLQAEWKKIGPVPSRDMNTIWKRFKSGCDRVFELSRLERQGKADDWKLKLYESFLKTQDK